MRGDASRAGGRPRAFAHVPSEPLVGQCRSSGARRALFRRAASLAAEGQAGTEECLGLVTAGLVAGLVMVGGTAFVRCRRRSRTQPPVSSTAATTPAATWRWSTRRSRPRARRATSLNWTRPAPAGRKPCTTELTAAAWSPAPAASSASTPVTPTSTWRPAKFTPRRRRRVHRRAGSGAGAGKAGPPGISWSLRLQHYGPQGPAGQDGTTARTRSPDIPCGQAVALEAPLRRPYRPGRMLTPVAITVSAGTCFDPISQNVRTLRSGRKGSRQ